MQNKPLLSICIPTYNREKYLEECLESIVHQKGFDQEDVEVIISDNASTDNTTELVHKYQKKYSNIKYHRNEENIGAIKNVHGLNILAGGEYTWLLSDDDLISSSALDFLMPSIKDGNLDLIVMKSLAFYDKKNLDAFMPESVYSGVCFTGLSQYLDFLGSSKTDILPYLGLMSVFCFKKSLYAENQNLLRDYYGEGIESDILEDNFIFAVVIFIPFGETKKILFIQNSLVLYRCDNISYVPKLKVVLDQSKFLRKISSIYMGGLKLKIRLFNIQVYSFFVYLVMVWIRRFLPKSMYNFMVDVGRKLIKPLRNTNSV